MPRKKKYEVLEHGHGYTPEQVKKLKIPAPPIHIQQMNVPHMWEHGYTGKGSVIAILDTGCDIENPLIKDKIVHYCNLTEDDDSNSSIVTDYIGHGTHIATLIAGDNYDDKVMGVAPDAKLMIYKVIDRTGYSRYELIARGVYAAIQRGANVINMSLAGREPAPEIHEAIKMANKMGCSVVVAAGNDGDDKDKTIEIAYPGCYDECIQVGSIGNDGKIAKFSNSNPYIDCVANGNALLSSHLNGNFATLSGTSQSAPLVCGALALLREWATKEYKRKVSESELYGLLIKNTKSIPDTDRNAQGHGMVYLDPYIDEEKSE